MFSILFFSFSVTYYLMSFGYNNIDIFEKSSRLDVVLHAHFVKDLLDLNFFNHTINGEEIFYMPTTPIILSIIAIPLYWMGLHILEATILSAAIIYSITTLGLYLQLQMYKLSRFHSLIISIVNPIILIGVLPWGGFSLIITSGCISWIIYFQLRLKSRTINRGIGYTAMSILLLISATAHRTGAIIQLFVLGVYFISILLSKGKAWLDSNAKLLFGIGLLIGVFIIIFQSRVLTLIDFGGESTDLGSKLYFTFFELPSRYTYFISTLALIGFLFTTINFIKSKNIFKLKDFTDRFDVIYLLCGIILYLYPLSDLELSTRFIVMFQGVIFYFYLLPFTKPSKLNYKIYDVLYACYIVIHIYILYFTLTISKSFVSWFARNG